MTILDKYLCVRTEIDPKPLKLEKIWFKIAIRLDLAYLRWKNYFLAISTASPLKNPFEDQQYYKNDDF